MLFDFSAVDDVQSFASIPAGSYPVRIAEVREGHTRDGSVRWAMRLEVAEASAEVPRAEAPELAGRIRLGARFYEAQNVPFRHPTGVPGPRHVRDIHTLCQQIQGHAAHFETVGQVLLGMEPDRPLFTF